VTRPDCPASQAVQLSFLAAVALGEAIGKVAPPMAEVTFKWPNDVLLNGRKAAGILLESKAARDRQGLEYLLIGMGVNIQSHPDDTPFPATSLRFEGCSPDVTETALLEAFSRAFLSWVNRWLDDGFAPVRKAWLNHAARKGEEIEVKLDKETLEGVFDDLDEEGHLLLKLADGRTRTISAGDVFFQS
jgi:BirA family biotin operon repressor/biotin-[acetyl-CoA-carboxylase] ligase